MARVFITGSSDGLGLLAGKRLVTEGHAVVLHARSAVRAEATKRALPECQAVVVGDVTSIRATRAVAQQVQALGRFDAVIHNVGIGDREPRRVETEDGLAQVFAVNVVAPYLLTALVDRPDRLVYLSSGMHLGGNASLDDAQWTKRRWSASQAYSDSKLYDLVLSNAVARHWPDVVSNAVDPGWVPTRMGGKGAPDDLEEGVTTQTWLAVDDSREAKMTGRYMFHERSSPMHPMAAREDVQERLLAYLHELTGVALAPR